MAISYLQLHIAIALTLSYVFIYPGLNYKTNLSLFCTCDLLAVRFFLLLLLFKICKYMNCKYTNRSAHMKHKRTCGFIKRVKHFFSLAYRLLF